MIERLYLAGPMRGVRDHNFPAFRLAAAELRRRGWEVWSPAEHDEAAGFDPVNDTAKPLKAYMADDLKAVCESDAVVVLPGWEDSQGAQLEVHVAEACGMPVWTYPDLRSIHEPVELLGPEIPPVPLPTEYPDNRNETILEEAERLVDGPRQESYGHPADDFTRTGRLWSEVLGVPVAPEQVAICMVLLKVSREVNAHKRDNLTDAAGYLRTLEKVLARSGDPEMAD